MALRIAVLILMLVVPASLAAQEAALSTPDLDQARQLVQAGKVVEARALLENVIRTDPKRPAAVAARALIDRIRSVEVHIDYSHDIPAGIGELATYLRANGIGTTRCHASLSSVADKLAEHELVILWQQTTEVKYDDTDYETLRAYVNAGGRVLLVGDPERWHRANPTLSLKRYPLPDLARRFRLRTRESLDERELGKGKVFYTHNRLLLTKGTLTSKDAKVTGKVMALFRKVAHERRAAVIVVTHDHRSLDVFDRTLEMEDGLISPTAPAGA